MRWAVRLTKPVLVLVSFTLSIVLYLFVQSPIDTNTVSLVLREKNLDKRLVFKDEGSSVEFSVSGPRDELDKLKQTLAKTPESVTAVVDLRGITPEMVRINPFVERHPVAQLNKPGDLDGLKFTPVKALDTKVEEPTTRLDVPIKVALVPAASPGATSASGAEPSDFETEPRTVNLTGPASQLTDVEPTVSVNADDVERSGFLTVPLELKVSAYAGSLPVVTNPRVEKVEVRATHHQRPVYVNINFRGRAANGYVVKDQYVVSGSEKGYTAVIRGPGNSVDKIGAIDATVIITGLKAPGFTFSVTPDLPRRVTLVDSPLKIHVDVAKSHK